MTTSFLEYDLMGEVIDPRHDPAPLLAEISRCILQGQPVRPALASWFATALEANRIHVKGRPGRPATITFEQWISAIEAVEKLQADGVPLEKAIAQVCKQTGRKRGMMRVWLDEMSEMRAADQEESHAHSKSIATAEFARLREQGMSNSQALQTVAGIRDWPTPPSLQSLELWQYEEEHGPLAGTNGTTLTKLPWQ